MQNETKTHWLTKSYGNGAFLLMRVWLGIAMLMHGYKSVIGGEMAGFVEYIDSFGIPAPIRLSSLQSPVQQPSP